MITLYDYKSQRSDELDLVKGDEILVLVRENESWWMGELVKSKQQGYFPASYVQEKSTLNDNSKFKIPKYSVKDAMAEFQKEYDTSQNFRNQIPELIPTITEMKKPLKSIINKVKAPIEKKISGNSIVSSVSGSLSQNIVNNEKNLTETYHVDDINEIPTRDQDQPM